ncbi:response regulator receiver domain protein (macronuclear) [Tetrahymena thermophila SB210]|uniref:Response regulator receiver domain protein n=1 Tax=Tetrahymena thermophila (strain SB210) TaxID=312017 RepID=I7M867_TETTS|nr:response regulator receiver domain protein [Tetrahymena thermophila SB210]EAR97266.2 response regulator receiver domain protein [Tetrahymena thermophila SB210]|eukprot:XP_001017511.2 response regulator receiver domain protein [Tetrahymena thermophila SB210]
MNDLNQRAQPCIMIVDDQQINILALKLILKRIGIEENNIIQANSGQEALQLLEDNKNIKIIFMDIEMPVINGFQATQLIKNRKQKQSVKEQQQIINIIAYTSLNDDETILKCKDAGMDYYLEKPCSLNSVSSVIQNYYFI